MRFLGDYTNKDFQMVTNYLGFKEDAHIDVANVSKGSGTTILGNVCNGLTITWSSGVAETSFI